MMEELLGYEGMNVTKMMCDSRILENYGTNKVDKFTSDEVKKQDK